MHFLYIYKQQPSKTKHKQPKQKSLIMAKAEQGIKLFGTTITLQEKEDREEAEDPTVEKRSPPSDKTIPCPRCKSTETKFCYFNNYNVNQPRHFCKGCQRYWTAGGALRNVPIGAGRRKSKPPSLLDPSFFHHDYHPFPSKRRRCDPPQPC